MTPAIPKERARAAMDRRVMRFISVSFAKKMSLYSMLRVLDIVHFQSSTKDPLILMRDTYFVPGWARRFAGPMPCPSLRRLDRGNGQGIVDALGMKFHRVSHFETPHQLRRLHPEHHGHGRHVEVDDRPVPQGELAVGYIHPAHDAIGHHIGLGN